MTRSSLPIHLQSKPAQLVCPRCLCCCTALCRKEPTPNKHMLSLKIQLYQPPAVQASSTSVPQVSLLCPGSSSISRVNATGAPARPKPTQPRLSSSTCRAQRHRTGHSSSVSRVVSLAHSGLATADQQQHLQHGTQHGKVGHSSSISRVKATGAPARPNPTQPRLSSNTCGTQPWDRAAQNGTQQ
jgi:hypothetical protein